MITETMDGQVMIRHIWHDDDVFDHEAEYDCACGPQTQTVHTVFELRQAMVDVIHPVLMLDEG